MSRVGPLLKRYSWGRDLGKGGFGQVRIVISKESGKEYACKSIRKRLDIANVSAQRQAAHLENIDREIKVLRRLRGALNVVNFRGAYEDDIYIHIVMEYCRGGELLHHISNTPHYTERTVASFMRAVLRTIMQCHSNNILHRDIKPGNFMLLDKSERSPLKAIDFGLAVFFDPEHLPRTDLGLEGTPWFMAPEALSSKVYPASDVWAAGVMAFQLLSGRLPFDDHRNPNAPSLSLVWKAVLSDPVVFKGKSWVDISADAKDFVTTLLNKDPEKRPSAAEALKHRWLTGTIEERGTGRCLRHTVVQRIQRYAQGSNALRRSIFELIAQELIKDLVESEQSGNASESPIPSEAGSRPGSRQGGMLRPISAGNLLKLLHMERGRGEASGSRKRPLSSIASEGPEDRMEERPVPGGGCIEGPPLLDRRSNSAHGGLEYFRSRGESVHGGTKAQREIEDRTSSSIHGGGSYWRIMRAAAAAARFPTRKGAPGRAYLHCVSRNKDEKQEHDKMSRLALDTSVHGSRHYQQLLRQVSLYPGSSLEAEEQQQRVQRGLERISTSSYPTSPDVSDSDAETAGQPSGGSSRPSSSQPPAPPQDVASRPVDPEEPARGRRAQGAYKAYLQSGVMAAPSPRPDPPAPRDPSPSGYKQERAVYFADEPSAPGANPLAPSTHAQNGTLAPQQHHVHFAEEPEPGGQRGHHVTFVLPQDDGGEGAEPMDVDVASSQRAGGHGAGGGGTGGEAGAGAASEGDVEMQSSSDSDVEGGDARHVPVWPTELKLPELAEVRAKQKAAAVDFEELRDILHRLNFSREDEAMTSKTLGEGLAKLGYKLEPEEMKILMQNLAGPGVDTVPRAAFVASQLDWSAIQQNYKEAWLAACRRVFAGLDKDKDNALDPSEDLVAVLASKLPQEEIEYAVEDALQAAGIADAESLDFEGFLRILGEGEGMDLEQYAARHPDNSVHGGRGGPTSPPSRSGSRLLI